MKSGLVALVAGALAACGILAAGGISLAVCTLAAISGGAFAHLARRAAREARVLRPDWTDLWSALGFFAILTGAAFDLGRTEDDPSASVAWALRVLGGAAIFGAMKLRASAARALGSSFVVRLRTHDDQRLVQSGPYARVRHPNYAALSLVAVGTALALASPLALALTCVVWLPIVIVRIAREERMLVERFGSAYAAYRRRTWRLLPGLY